MEASASVVRPNCALRTPEQRQSYRMGLHKSGGKSPAWKDAYRKRCMDRLRESRHKFMSRFRSISSSQSCGRDHLRSTVQEVMMQEWEGLRSEAWSGDLGGDYLDHVLGVMDELQEELIREEQSILAQYEQANRFDEDALCAAIDSLTTDDIICPICQKNVLHQNHHIIFCACGVRIDTAQDGVTLDYIKAQLEECSAQHSSTCLGRPVFTMETTLGLQNIIMNCPVCEFMFIVI